MECFIVYSDKIEGRMDPFYYKPEFREFKKALTSIKVEKLGDIANFQYGLNEIAKENGDIIYIRITDIDENGLLKKDELAYLDYKDEYANYKLQNGDLLIARIGATFGKSFYFNENLNAVFAGYLIRIKLKTNQLNPKFLFYFFQTQYFKNQARMLVRGGAQPQFNANTIKDLLIPILPLQTQNHVVTLMDKVYFSKKTKESEAQKLLDSIDTYVLNELGIKLPELKDKLSYIVNSNELEGKRVDPYYYQPKFKELEKAIENSKFGVVNVGTKLNILDKLEDINKYTYINYVDLSSVNKSLGLITNYNKLNPSEAPSRAKQKIEKGDLLLSGLSGSLKSIAVFDNSFDNAICSTGFYVIKSSENYNNYFLWALFRTDIFQLILQREASGAIMSAINREAFVNLKIPLPSLTIQNKIADEVKKRIEEAKRLQKEAEKELVNAKQEVEALILNS